MPLKNPDNFNIYNLIIIFIASTFGACARYLYDLKSEKIKQFKLLALVSDIFIALFAGAVVYSLINHLYDFRGKEELLGGLCGVAGWGGASTIKLIMHFFSKKLGLDDEGN